MNIRTIASITIILILGAVFLSSRADVHRGGNGVVSSHRIGNGVDSQ